VGKRSISIEEAAMAVLRRARKPLTWVEIHKRILHKFKWNTSSDELIAELRRLSKTVLIRTFTQVPLGPHCLKRNAYFEIEPLHRLAMVAK
jgi:hypothetical protein